MENLTVIATEISHAHWSSFLSAHGVKPPAPIQLRGAAKTEPTGITREGIRNALLGGG